MVGNMYLLTMNIITIFLTCVMQVMELQILTLSPNYIKESPANIVWKNSKITLKYFFMFYFFKLFIFIIYSNIASCINILDWVVNKNKFILNVYRNSFMYS